MALLRRKKPAEEPAPPQTGRAAGGIFSILERYVPLCPPEYRLYDAIREAIPVADAAIGKTVRLVGGFKAVCRNERTTAALGAFLENVQVGVAGRGIEVFLSAYLDQLLTYGTAAAEMVPPKSGRGIAALYNVPLDAVELLREENSLALKICKKTVGTPKPLPHPERVMISVLNPKPGEIRGRSLLCGLPFVSSVLLKIFNTTGVNFERVGNLRFAVTCKNPGEGASAKERAAVIAKEWSSAMQSGSSGRVRDFVAVGDVDIKVIGADSQILDTEIPVRQMLEQIVAKTGIPPFMLGLSWSSTERMSAQQADILTSELESYRRLLTPMLKKICAAWLFENGMSPHAEILWDNISLQDEVELGRAGLLAAQAEEIRQRTEKGGEKA